jgi:hypothetical protein
VVEVVVGGMVVEVVVVVDGPGLVVRGGAVVAGPGRTGFGRAGGTGLGAGGAEVVAGKAGTDGFDGRPGFRGATVVVAGARAPTTPPASGRGVRTRPPRSGTAGKAPPYPGKERKAAAMKLCQIWAGMVPPVTWGRPRKPSMDRVLSAWPIHMAAVSPGL